MTCPHHPACLLFINGECCYCFGERRKSQSYFNKLLDGIHKQAWQCPDKLLDDVMGIQSTDYSAAVMEAEKIIKNHERSLK